MAQLAALKSTDPLVAEKRRQLDRILQHCLGLEVETTIPQAEVVPGEELQLHHTATVHADVPVRWMATRYPSTAKRAKKAGARLHAGPDDHATIPNKLCPPNTPLTQPYWLREERPPGMFRVADPR